MEKPDTTPQLLLRVIVVIDNKAKRNHDAIVVPTTNVILFPLPPPLASDALGLDDVRLLAF